MGNYPLTMKKLSSYIGRYWYGYVFAVASMLIAITLDMLYPKITQSIVDAPSLVVRSRRATMWFVVSASWFLWMFTSLDVLHALRLSFMV